MTIKISCDQCGHTWDVSNGEAIPQCHIAIPNDSEASSSMKLSFMEMMGHRAPSDVTVEKFHLCLECAMALLIAFKHRKIDIEKKRDVV